MKIAPVSKITRLSAHTIRYYEKLGLVKGPSKDTSGHRNYSAEQVDLLNWIACLKKSGMTLQRIQEYVEASQSDLSIQILNEHLSNLYQQKHDIDHYIDVTQRKIRSLNKA